MARVLLVDDDASLREVLTFALEEIGHDVEAHGDGASALAAITSSPPEIVITDLKMPGLDGMEVLRRVHTAHPAIQVIVLTSFKEDDLVQGALQAGAIGYLLKNVSTSELADAIRAAYAGRPTLAPEAAQALIHTATRNAVDEPGHDLTEREREVLRLMVKGLNNTDIAEQLVVSRSTVKFHVSNILSKLHVTSRTEAVAYALQHNLVR